MAINGISSNSYSFGSLANIRREAAAIAKRVEEESKAREAEQEATGLMKNAKGDMVEISSIPEWERAELNRRAALNTISPREALLAALATAPNEEEVEQSKALAAKFVPIQNKMLSGKKLTGAEKAFLQKHYPEFAVTAERMEGEARQLEERLKSAKSPDEANRIYIEAKMSLMSGAGKNDGSLLFMMPAIDGAYSRYMKRDNSSGHKTNIWA